MEMPTRASLPCQGDEEAMGACWPRGLGGRGCSREGLGFCC